MKKILITFGLILASVFAVAAPSPELTKLQHKSAHTIILMDAGDKHAAGCSATAIDEHVLLTAQHCDIAGARVYIDQNTSPLQRAVVVSEKYYDQNDHMLLVLPGVTFKFFVPYYADKVRVAQQGEHVYLWGNPGLMMNQYREGYVSGTMNFGPQTSVSEEISASGNFSMMTVPIIGGDSGSSVYSAVDGQLIGITTWGINGGMFLGSYPLQFTQEQIDQAAGKGTLVYAPEPIQSKITVTPAPIVIVRFPMSQEPEWVIAILLSGLFLVSAYAAIKRVATTAFSAAKSAVRFLASVRFTRKKSVRFTRKK